jgi:hypothetical protein
MMAFSMSFWHFVVSGLNRRSSRRREDEGLPANRGVAAVSPQPLDAVKEGFGYVYSTEGIGEVHCSRSL